MDPSYTNRTHFPAARRIAVTAIAGLFALLWSSCSALALDNGVVDPATLTAFAIESVTDTPAPSATAEPTAIPSPSPSPEPTAVPTETTAPTPTDTPLPVSGDTRISPVDGMVQVFIEAGEFLMGSIDNEAIQRIEGGRAYPEIPQHVNTTGDYWFDMYEVSNAQYALCVAAGVCTPPYLSKSETRESYFGNPEFDNYPVIWVSWYMANDYCAWAGRRLPTEAEWEKAARGTEGLKYPWGNDLGEDPPANFCDTNCGRTIANHKYDDGYPDTAPVDSFPDGVSPFGIFNMSGNVWEWTSTI
ncbi:MAG TPA: formylglycine-generating enzyme family protein, partial [Anaerolineales bacterium]|nr:formylglycine-generating enzyme family protein [Anaerolineales bacterium]